MFQNNHGCSLCTVWYLYLWVIVYFRFFEILFHTKLKKISLSKVFEQKKMLLSFALPCIPYVIRLHRSLGTVRRLLVPLAFRNRAISLRVFRDFRDFSSRIYCVQIQNGRAGSGNKDERWRGNGRWGWQAQGRQDWGARGWTGQTQGTQQGEQRQCRGHSIEHQKETVCCVQVGMRKLGKIYQIEVRAFAWPLSSLVTLKAFVRLYIPVKSADQ